MKATLVSIICSVLIGLATPASAAVFTATYTGTASGTDGAGLFGAAGGSLDGLSYTAIYTYDSSTGIPTIVSNMGSSSASLDGAADSVTLTINGIGLTLVGETNFGDFVDRTQTSIPTSVATDKVALSTGDLITSYLYLDNNNIPASFTTEFSTNTADIVNNIGNFGLNNAGGSLGTLTYGYLYADSLTVAAASVSAVPLPASFPMFGATLFGLAAAGYGLRRRPGNRPA